MNPIIGLVFGRFRHRSRYAVPCWITVGASAICDGIPVTIQHIDNQRGIIEATTSSGNQVCGPVSVFEKA